MSVPLVLDADGLDALCGPRPPEGLRALLGEARAREREVLVPAVVCAEVCRGVPRTRRVEAAVWLPGGPARVDDGLLDLLEQQTTDLETAFFGSTPVGVLLVQARAHLRATLGLLDGSMAPSARQRLSVIAGATSGLVPSPGLSLRATGLRWG